jgi:glycine betaine catabolism B
MDMMPQLETQALEIVQRTGSARSIRFAKPSGFDYLPGQFVILALSSDNGVIKKPLSLSSSPTEDFLEVTKRLTGHEFSNAFLSIKEGDILRFSGPSGNFTLKGEHKAVCMLSGGIGITPLRSMIKYSTDRALDTDIFIIYSNKHEDDIPFSDEFESLKAKNKALNIVNTLTRPSPSWKGLTGRINASMIRELLPDYERWAFYSSGPRKMVDAMLLVLKEMNIPDGRVFKEYFPGYD